MIAASLQKTLAERLGRIAAAAILESMQVKKCDEPRTEKKKLPKIPGTQGHSVAYIPHEGKCGKSKK
jgi:hypothetical protein